MQLRSNTDPYLNGLNNVVENKDFVDQLKFDFSAFRQELRKVLDADTTRTWAEETYETYEHGRVHELGVWWLDEENKQQFGYVFLAKVGWRGVKPEEWGKIHQIVHTHNWAIGPFEDVKVWNLNGIISQYKPLPRCTRCGLVIEE